MATEQTKVILSSGYGRLHFAQSAHWLGKAGVAVDLVCGWVPRNANSILVKLCSKIIGRDLSSGLRKRQIHIENGGRVISLSLVDFLCNFLNVAERKLTKGRCHGTVMRFSWSLFGKLTKKYLCRGSVFHVRSGAGQGGAIKKAKKLGIPVLVDHSALHPATSAENLKDECLRWNCPLPIDPGTGVWINVLKDCKAADVIMVNADHIRDSFVYNGFNKDKIKVVYLGVREDFMGLKTEYSSRGVFRILYTGAFYLLKGAEYLLEAIRILTEQGIEVQCDIVGSCNIPEALANKYAGLPVIYHGAVPQDDLKAFLAKADVYLFPSLADGCANSGMEAMAAGLPVVATRQSGLPIEDSQTGCIVPMKNARAIADKLQWLAQNQQVRERLGRNAAEAIRTKYTWQQYAENVKQIYQDLLEKTAKR